jgi:hypothetical protein
VWQVNPDPQLTSERPIDADAVRRWLLQLPVKG